MLYLSRKSLHLAFLLMNAYCGFYSCVQFVTKEVKPLASLAYSKQAAAPAPMLF